MKLLVNTPQFIQEIIDVYEGGGYFDADSVIWDERIDGKLPEINILQLGGLEKIDGILVFNESLKQTNDGKQIDSKSEVLKQIVELDLKRIRPLAENDTVYLADLNEKIKALRALL